MAGSISRVGPGFWNYDNSGFIRCCEGVRAKVCVNKRTLDDKSKAAKGIQSRNIYFGRWSGEGVIGCEFFKKLEI